jgi:hypothetical protein
MERRDEDNAGYGGATPLDRDASKEKARRKDVREQLAMGHVVAKRLNGLP